MSQRDFRAVVDNLRERARTSDDISAADGEFLVKFSDQMDLLQSEYGDARHKKLLGNCVRLAEAIGGLSDALEDREAAEELVRYINREYDNEESNRDYRIALRMFGKRLAENGLDVPTDDNGIPETLAWIPSTYPSDYNPKPDPSNMLRWEEEVVPMIDAARNTRDAAMAAVAWNLGARPFEFQAIQVGDITDSSHGLTVTVDGKRGQRSATLVNAVPHLQQWLADHPDRENGDAPLWCKLTKPEPISDRMVRKVFEELADRAGVTRPVTLSNFRKSCASFLARRNVNQVHIENHMGWTTGSDVAARYVAVFAPETEKAVAAAQGADVEESEDDDISPLTCPRCGRETPGDKSLCVWCGQAVDPEAGQQAEALDDLMAESLAQASGEDARRLLDFRDATRENPELRAEMIEEVARLLDH